MPVRLRRATTSSKSYATKGDARPDDRLALVDQAFFAGHRAAGQNEVMQVVWLYKRPVDFDGVRRVYRNLGYGLLGRRIERSPLPFARYRWVLDRGPACKFTLTERSRATWSRGSMARPSWRPP